LWLPLLNTFFGWLKFERGLVNLGQFYPHQRFTNTSCPGIAALKVLNQFDYWALEEDDDMVDEVLRGHVVDLKTVVKAQGEDVAALQGVVADMKTRMEQTNNEIDSVLRELNVHKRLRANNAHQ
jgi:hypothetical protein